jgi:hypothetical protein
VSILNPPVDGKPQRITSIVAKISLFLILACATWFVIELIDVMRRFAN